MTNSTVTSPRVRRHRVAFLVVTFVAMTVMCSVPAQAYSCADEYLELTDPVVSVVEGPGDAAQEQGRWSALNAPYIEGGYTLHLESQHFGLEKVK